MDYNELLQKQVNKHLTVEQMENPSLTAFLQSINASYLAFESDKENMNFSFQESLKQNNEISNLLNNEIDFKQIAINNLDKNIDKQALDYEMPQAHNDDLLQVSDYLPARISKRKAAEIALVENMKELEDYKFALDQSAIVAIMDENGVIRTVNDKFCEISQFSKEELVGNTHKIITSNFHSKAFMVKLKSTLSAGNIWKGLVRNKKKNGEYYWVDTTIVPFFDACKKRYQYLAVYFDVTAIKNAETEIIKAKELAEQSEKYNRIILDSSLNSIVSTDMDKRITFWNQQAELVFGWKEEEVVGKLLVDLLIPFRYRAIWNTIMDQYLISGEVSYFNKQLEIILINKAGNEFYAETSITPIILGDTTNFCAFIQDISKRKEVENKLLQTAELLKAFLFNLQSGIIVVDDAEKIIFINQHFCDLRGIKSTPEEMVGIDYTVLLAESKLIFKDQESYVQKICEMVNRSEIVIGEILETIDNRFIERDYIPIFLDKDRGAHLWKSSDVTQRIRDQKLLEQSEQRNSLIMSSSLNAIVNVDSEGKITFWNHRAELIFGYKTEEIIGRQISETILPNQNKNIYDTTFRNLIRKDLGSDFHKHFELLGIKNTGEEIIIDCSIVSIIQNEKSFFCLFIQDVSEKKEAENLRRIQEEKYQNVIAHMNLGLLEVDNNDVILYANQSFVVMSGYEKGELIGKKTTDIFITGENVHTLNSKNKIRKEGISDIYQVPIKNKSGEQQWWAISGAPNYDSKGNVVGSIGIHLDITQQKRLEIELEKEKVNALESSKAKEVFLANMSHEIRTPLNAIIGFLRELEKQELSEIQKKYINNSSIASKHLMSIINNILDISKIEAGEMSLEEEDFVFEKKISNVMAVLHPMLTQKGLDLNITISNKISKVLRGDALRIQQILFNLIGNAIKFTSKGSIAINCEVVDDNAIFQKLQISISDTGIGMEKSFVSTIFNKFSQEDKAITRKYGGTGLGLSITRELVKLMGGKIEIESEKYVGTIIHIFLNFIKGSIQNIEIKNVDKQCVSIENISILVVEDNYLNRMVVQNSLQYYNCKVTEAENGLEAIEILKNRNFDIILMDIQMPEMGGIEATEIIRKELNLSTPIIALTANAFKSEIDKCKNAGMNDYVCKPFDENVLIETIAKYTINQKIILPEAVFLETAADDQLYNLTSLNNLSRGNEDFVVKMVAIFIDQTTDVIQKISEAIILDDFMEVSRLIHKIKPSIESLGIKSIVEEIKLLEKIAKKTNDKEQITALFDTIKEVLEKTVVQLKDHEIRD